MREWIVVLNQTEARVLGRKQAQDPLRFEWKLINPIGRTRNRELRHDHPGAKRMRIKGSMISHACQTENTPHDDAKLAFMQKVAEALNGEHAKKSFDSVTIFCDAHLAGLLAKSLEARLRREVRWIHKNLSKLSDREIESRLESA